MSDILPVLRLVDAVHCIDMLWCDGPVSQPLLLVPYAPYTHCMFVLGVPNKL